MAEHYKSTVLTGVLALGLAHCSAALAEGPADLVLRGGKILTVDATDSVAEAIAVRDGVIVAVGNAQAVEEFLGPATTVMELSGRVVTPGLIDTHVHFADGGIQKLTQIDLSYPNVKSVGDVARLVTAMAQRPGRSGWILGGGWDEGKLAEQRYLTAADLNPATGNIPAWLMHTMGHYGVANSAALALAGITAATPNPPGGIIVRDENGEPTGVLKESAMALVLDHVPPPGEEGLRDAIRFMAGEFNRECMTGAKDPGMSAGNGLESAMKTWRAYEAVKEEGSLSVRLFALWPGGQDLAEAQRVIETIGPFTNPNTANSTGGEDRLISGGVKLYADGSGGARTAWMWDDWNISRVETDAGNRGYPAIEPVLMHDMIDVFHDAGLTMGIHAIGDRAIDWVSSSLMQAALRNPQHGLRHTIIHANLASSFAIDTLAALQGRFDAGYPEPAPGFTWWLGDTYAGTFGESRSQRLNPLRSFQERGVQWGGSSDFYVTPFPARYGIWSSVARRPLLGVYGSDVFGQLESVDVQTALRSYTLWAAHNLFLDNKVGSIEVGKFADLAIWDRDIYSVDTDELKDMQCQMTLLEGEIVYRRDGVDF